MYKVLLVCLTLVTVNYCGELRAQQLVDPTKPFSGNGSFISGSGAVNGELVLQSILINDNVKLVIINGQQYQLGDIVADYKISSIVRNKAILVKPNETLELLLFKKSRFIAKVTNKT